MQDKTFRLGLTTHPLPGRINSHDANSSCVLLGAPCGLALSLAT